MNHTRQLPPALHQLGGTGFDVLSLNTAPPGADHPQAANWVAAQAAAAVLNAASSDVARSALAAFAEGSGSIPGDDMDGDMDGDMNPRPNKRGKAGANGSQADYAQRHQAAEQRRRARINERLEALRKLVPHDPRSNTASFLEDVIKHILMLKDTNDKLEQALIAAHPGAAGVAEAAAAATAAAARNSQAAAGPSAGPSARAGGNTPPSSSSSQPLHPSLMQPHNLQQLLALQAGQQAAGGGSNNSGRMQVLPQALTNIASGGNQALLAQELDAGTAHVQQALLALQQHSGGANPEQQEALLRNLLASKNQLHLLSGSGMHVSGMQMSNEHHHLGGVQRTGSGTFQQLLSAVGQLANSGGLHDDQHHIQHGGGHADSHKGDQGDLSR